MLHDLFYITAYRGVSFDGEALEPQSTGYVAHYSLPFGYWLLSMTHSGYDYSQNVVGAVVDYEYSGRSSNSEIEIERVVFRGAKRKSTLSLQSYLKRSRSYIDDTEINVQRRGMSGVRVALAHREFVGDGTFDIELAHRRWLKWFDATADRHG
ncbi:hypothetical protein BOW53_15005 [Solemya pervernicosa gill symbiont]|uniref:Haemolysin activator HlyB C-terminal domain-containing protein n=1 Tax=Solemya pervernicosa gill symbiont TaxID=642797 RepID=A0A1T2L0L3_9GAMM|nr:ShlB/FhaC/HecB family hemolysin secretion/activation protein [Solemya pervernicosa gill symbiont]OOZ38604.1 hypothetical protein BOW53_15005 [Solemya pervernicosa gill symbiont]